MTCQDPGNTTVLANSIIPPTYNIIRSYTVVDVDHCAVGAGSGSIADGQNCCSILPFLSPPILSTFHSHSYICPHPVASHGSTPINTQFRSLAPGQCAQEGLQGVRSLPSEKVQGMCYTADYNYRLVRLTSPSATEPVRVRAVEQTMPSASLGNGRRPMIKCTLRGELAHTIDIAQGSR